MQRNPVSILQQILFVTIFSISACEDKKDTRDIPTPDSDLSDNLASEPVPVTGAYLSCGYLDSKDSAEQTAVGCNPYDVGSQQVIDLDISAQNVVWSYESLLSVAMTNNYIDANNFRWQVRFDFSSPDAIARQTQVLDTKIALSYNRKGSNEKVQIQDRIKNILIELAEHRFIKIAYLSVHMNPPADSLGLPDTVDFEFKINGVWEKVLIRLDTLNFTAHTMQSDRFAFKFLGSESDWKMHLQTGMGKDLAAMFANNFEAISWKTSMGDTWLFNADSSFVSEAPYDLKEAAKPIELLVDMGAKKSFNGFRLDGGLNNPGRALPNGFPDRFSFLFSDDNKTWTPIRGSESSLVGRSQLEWAWDK